MLSWLKFMEVSLVWRMFLQHLFSNFLFGAKCLVIDSDSTAYSTDGLAQMASTVLGLRTILTIFGSSYCIEPLEYLMAILWSYLKPMALIFALACWDKRLAPISKSMWEMLDMWQSWWTTYCWGYYWSMFGWAVPPWSWWRLKPFRIAARQLSSDIDTFINKNWRFFSEVMQLKKHLCQLG